MGQLPDTVCPLRFLSPLCYCTSSTGNYPQQIQVQIYIPFGIHASVYKESPMVSGLSVVVNTSGDSSRDTESIWRQMGQAAD